MKPIELRPFANFATPILLAQTGKNGGKFINAEALCQHLLGFWPNDSDQNPFVVLTGGEPLLQVDEDLITTLHKHKFEIAVETHGTKTAPTGISNW